MNITGKIYNIRNKSGFTLIEIMVALAIVAFVSIVALPGINNIFNENLRSSSRRLAGAIKYIYNQAIIKNKTMRLVYDFADNKYWAEVVTDKFLLIEKDDSSITNIFEEDDEVENKFTEGKNELISARELTGGVKFVSVCSSLNGVLVKEGRAYTHFFPNGVIEGTLIHLGFKDKIYSVDIEPMLGYAKVYDQYEESTCVEE